MASTATTSQPSIEELTGEEEPATDESPVDVVAFRETDEGKKLVDWATGEYERCRGLKARVSRQWYINLNMTFGRQWIEAIATTDQRPQLRDQQVPKWKKKKTVNRLRSFVRTECSKFQSQLPNVVSVPSTAEDQDVRSAFAAEQTWMSYSEVKRFRRQYSAAIWWTVVTGNGFLKVWWNSSLKVKMPDATYDGDIDFRKVSPLNIFVPEMREREIDDQPYVIEAYLRTVDWVRKTYGEVLKGVDLTASSNNISFLSDEAFQRQGSTNKLDSMVVQEVWVKPGATNLLPEGGYLVLVDDILVDYYKGLPYNHGEFPYTKFEHMYNDTFWADSPLVDLIPLQKEYNELRTDIGIAARRMGSPQLLAAKGSVDPSRMTNEPGAVIPYVPGLPAPTPLPLTSIPQYVIDQQDRILADFEDVSGQHEISKGSAPSGITAGTALAYLGERDDAYLTPQYQGIEEGFERVARQTLVLFQQYVDYERKIKIVGLDGSMDTLLLEGSDIANGTDVRVERGSAVGQSQAAKQAQVMDMVGLGIIPPEQALKLLELGGPQKVLDIVSAAERKAQRENMRMKAFKDDLSAIEASEAEFLDQAVQMIENDPEMMAMASADPAGFMEQIKDMIPPTIPVDDFDLHEVHIEVHNRFRMSQEYETLPDEVKGQFEKHVAWHQQMGGAIMSQQLMAQMPPELGGGGAPGEDPAAGAPPAPDGSMAPPAPQGPPPGAPPM